MPLSEAAILAYEKKEKFQNASDPDFDLMLQASFVSILKPLPHLAQFLHLSAVR